jgi:hypothetical protein
MPDQAHLIPESLDEFTATLEPPDPGVVSGYNPTACGGGLVECAALTSAETTAREEMTKFLTSVVRGFQAYEQIATACRNTYQSGDQRSAATIAKASDHVTEN